MKDLQPSEIIHTIKNAKRIDLIRLIVFESEQGEPYIVFCDQDTDDIDTILDEMKDEYSIISCEDILIGDTVDYADGLTQFIDLRLRKTPLNHNITKGVIKAFKGVVFG